MGKLRRLSFALIRIIVALRWKCYYGRDQRTDQAVGVQGSSGKPIVLKERMFTCAYDGDHKFSCAKATRVIYPTWPYFFRKISFENGFKFFFSQINFQVFHAFLHPDMFFLPKGCKSVLRIDKNLFFRTKNRCKILILL